MRRNSLHGDTEIILPRAIRQRITTHKRRAFSLDWQPKGQVLPRGKRREWPAILRREIIRFDVDSLIDDRGHPKLSPAIPGRNGFRSPPNLSSRFQATTKIRAIGRVTPVAAPPPNRSLNRHDHGLQS